MDMLSLVLYIAAVVLLGVAAWQKKSLVVLAAAVIVFTYLVLPELT